MKRIAVIADIHGNKPALDAAIKDIKSRGIHTIWCLGDILDWKDRDGLYCLGQILKTCPVIVRGNHDQDVLEYDRIFLDRLPLEYISDSQRIGCWHGSPKNPLSDYVHDVPTAREALESALVRLPKLRLAMVGHIHKPSAYTCSKELMSPDNEVREITLPDEPVIACPGSIGQSHGSSDGKAQWMQVSIWDDETPAQISWHETWYRDALAPTSFVISI